MQIVGFLVAVQDGPTNVPIIIGPRDDVWFVAADNFPPTFTSEREAIEERGGLLVLGAVVEGDHD